jgi:parallel beta-helix repeat protein
MKSTLDINKLKLKYKIINLFIILNVISKNGNALKLVVLLIYCEFMNKKREYLVIILTFTLMLLAASIALIVLDFQSNQDDEIKEIYISKDSDFIKYQFPGNGSKYNPYVIEKYSITDYSDFAISVVNTSKYFIIQDCYFRSYGTALNIENIANETAIIKRNTCVYSNYGIKLSNSYGVIISDNICNGSDNAIHLTNSSAKIVNNTCLSYSSDDGILLFSTENCLIANNTCSGKFGIRMDASKNTSIINNFCESRYGIYLTNSHNSSLTNNTIINAYQSIYLKSTTNNEVKGNNCSNDSYGITLHTTYSTDVYNNSCTYSYWRGMIVYNSLKINLMYNNITKCTERGLYVSSSTNITISKNLANENGLGLCVKESEYVTISENSFSNCIYGIDYEYTNFSSINKNIILNNTQSGIEVYLSFYCEINENICDFNKDGIYAIGSGNLTLINSVCNNNTYSGVRFLVCNNLTIVNNTCSLNKDGIVLDAGEFGLVKGNNCYNNSNKGIHVGAFSNLTLCFNNITANKYGLNLNMDNRNSSIISFNLFVDNSNYAIYFSGFTSSYNNAIHHNTFIDNNPGGTSQAYGGGLNNYWYDINTNEGNFWSDWSGSGIYLIDGTSNNDLYPLVVPP